MSSSGLRISVVDSKNDKLDSKLPNIERSMKKNYRISCRDNFNEYLFNSSMHGLRYVGDRTISYFERAFFAFMFFLVILLSIYFISNVWSKWSSSPIITTLNSKSTSVKDIPFPATTICNMNQVRRSVVRNITKNSEEYDIILALCGFYRNMGNKTIRTVGDWGTFRDILLKVTPTCEDMILWCSYGGREFNCTSRFRTVLTDNGFCCTFNGVESKYLMKTVSKDIEESDDNDTINNIENMWTAERGYASQEFKRNEEKNPRPGVGSGNELGLSVILNADLDDYFCTSTESIGFKVLIHNPNDLPKVAHYGIAIPNNYESRVAVTPTLSVATPATRKMTIATRQCIFEDENFLSFYNTYSERNCQSECVTKQLYERYDGGCILKFINDIRGPSPTLNCDQCISACFALYYESTLTLAKIFPRVPFLRKRKLDPRDAAIVHIYYSRSTFRAHKKEELVGLTDFLSGIGGLLGLFMGFSVISVIEVFYFVSIRPYCNYLRLSNRRRELMMGVIRKMRNLRERKQSVFRTKTAQSNSNYDQNYQRRYLN